MKNQSKKHKRIIIRMPNFIGDSINATPALELVAQAYPDAEITLLGPSFLRELFQNDPRVKNVITADKKKKRRLATLYALLSRHFDLGILFSNTLSTALLMRMGGVKRLAGYNNEGRGFLLDYKPKLNRNTHYINRYAMLVNGCLGDKFTHLPPLKIYFDKNAGLHLPPGKPVVGLYLGGTNKKQRRYPETYAPRLLRLLCDYRLVLLGDANDAPAQAEYARQVPEADITDLSGKTSIEEFVATIAGLDLLITIDSAAMHIAAATNIKFIALFGLSTSPTSAILPRSANGVYLKIENNLINEADYMNNLTPETILQHVHSILAPRHEKQ